MEQDIRFNIDLGMSLENMIEEMLLNIEVYNYERGEEKHFVELIKSIYYELTGGRMLYKLTEKDMAVIKEKRGKYVSEASWKERKKIERFAFESENEGELLVEFNKLQWSTITRVLDDGKWGYDLYNNALEYVKTKPKRG